MITRRFDAFSRTTRALFLVCATSLCTFLPSIAHADGLPTPTPKTVPTPEAKPVAAPAPSGPIDYGKRPLPASAGDSLLWVPRVVVFPAYVVSEYVIREPLAAFTIWFERHDVAETLKNLFTFGPNNNIGVVPTGLLDFRLRPSVGIYFFWDDFLAKDNALRIHVATGGSDWFRGTVTDRIGIGHDASVHLRFEGGERPDYVFFGLGPRALEQNRSRYGAVSFEESVGFAFDRHGNGIEAYTSVKDIRFDATQSCCGDPSIADRVRAGELDLPPGLRTYTALRQGLWGSLDSRKPRPFPGSGARIEGNAEHAVDLRDPNHSRWLRWGGSVGGFVDLTGKDRILSLSVAARFADPLGDATIPFTELPTLGGDDPMHGFLPGRVRDRSTVASTLEYRWPIWAFLDGSAQFAVGNAFGAHLEGFSPDLLRMAFTVGIRSNGSRDHSFNVMVGSGTETFRDGAALNSFRLLFGATRGF